MLARLQSIVWALSVAFIGNGSCFQPVASPFGKIDSRGRTTGAKSSPNFVSTRRQHVSEAARVVRPDSSESGFGQARDRHGEGGDEEGGPGGRRSPLLMDYFVRHSIESGEIVPAVDSNGASGDAEAAAGVVFVKTVIFQADGKPFAAVMREDLVADRAKMARHLRLTSRQVTLAKAPYVEDVTGFPVGTIPPLGHRTRVPTLVDAELLKYSTIVGGAGLRTQKKILCSGRASDGGGCQSEVRATMGRKSREWRISYVDLQHANCSGGVAKATGATLAPFAAEAMANNPHMNSADLGRLYKKNVGLQAKPRTVRRHKKDALDAIQAADAGSIQQAPGYCRELVERSPGTVATVERDPDGTFNRLSIVVGRAAFVIAKGLFKFLQIDGGHMKGKWNGMVLVATGKDTNNTLVVVAFVMCDKENAANYSFLLSEMKNPHLKKLLEDPLKTLYTDEHKGSKAAIQREAEPVIHRLCLKHLAGNFPGPGIGEA
eukprot:g2327.t1